MYISMCVCVCVCVCVCSVSLHLVWLWFIIGKKQWVAMPGHCLLLRIMQLGGQTPINFIVSGHSINQGRKITPQLWDNLTYWPAYLTPLPPTPPNAHLPLSFTGYNPPSPPPLPKASPRSNQNAYMRQEHFHSRMQALIRVCVVCVCVCLCLFLWTRVPFAQKLSFVCGEAPRRRRSNIAHSAIARSRFSQDSRGPSLERPLRAT